VKEETTYGLSPQRLARLLAIGIEGACEGEDPAACRALTDVLKEMLDNKLPLDPSLPDSLPALLNWTSDQVLAAAGHAMSNLLLDPKTDLSVIKVLKDYAKELARRGAPEAKQAAATVIYYAAIASALAFHEHKMSLHSYEKLHEAYIELRKKAWIPPELKGLFRKASEACRQKTGTT